MGEALGTESRPTSHTFRAPSLWPIGFAIGDRLRPRRADRDRWIVAVVGAAIAVSLRLLWIRDPTRGYATTTPERRARARRAAFRRRPPPPTSGDAAMPVMADEEIDRYPRNSLPRGATLGLGAVIGGVVTVPVLGFTVAPAFVDQAPEDVDLGPITNFPEGEFVIATFLRDPTQGEVTRRTAYVRNNGATDQGAELHDPLQPLRAPRLPGAAERARLRQPAEEVRTLRRRRRGHAHPDDPRRRLRLPVPRRPVRHRGQPHGRPARPRARPLRVRDQQRPPRRCSAPTASRRSTAPARAAQDHAYDSGRPGQHVDGPEALLYPIQPPH